MENFLTLYPGCSEKTIASQEQITLLQEICCARLGEKKNGAEFLLYWIQAFV